MRFDSSDQEELPGFYKIRSLETDDVLWTLETSYSVSFFVFCIVYM